MTSMTAPPDTANPSKSPVAFFGGIDTHKSTHHVAIVDATGRPITDRQFDTTPTAYAEIVAFFKGHGTVERVGVEGTGSYGAGIARALDAAGIIVREIARPNRQHRRLKGKSDPIDAHQAALGVIADTHTSTPKSGDGTIESIRILMAERHSAVKARSQTMNQIHSLLITAPDRVRQDYRALDKTRLVTVLTRTRPAPGDDPDAITRQTLKRLAARHTALHDELAIIDIHLDALIRVVNPALLALSGVGVVVAATLLTAAGDNPERLTSKAAFASLCGAAPIPASSGQRIRHRLSRGGNRQANSALHRIVLLRMRHREPRTAEYFDRRRAEGLSDRDIIRCLKRHIANEVFHTLTHPSPDAPAGVALRARRQALGIPITVLAATLGVPYQKLRRLEIGTRGDTTLEHQAHAALDQITPPATP
jgi:transposase